jgi:hypothetical protein
MSMKEAVVVVCDHCQKMSAPIFAKYAWGAMPTGWRGEYHHDFTGIEFHFCSDEHYEAWRLEVNKRGE